jgi:hypothetical protein
VRERREASGLLGLRAEKKGWAANRRKGGPRREERLVGLKEREGEEGRFCEFSFFFSNSFSNFTQTIKPCIRIMMHKHLLFLALLK